MAVFWFIKHNIEKVIMLKRAKSKYRKVQDTIVFCLLPALFFTVMPASNAQGTTPKKETAMLKHQIGINPLWLLQPGYPGYAKASEVAPIIGQYRYFISPLLSAYANGGYYGNSSQTGADTETGVVQANQFYGWQAQAGMEKRIKPISHLTTYLGAGFVFQHRYADTAVFFNNGSQIQKTVNNQVQNNFGVSINLTAEIEITRRISISSRVEMRLTGEWKTRTFTNVLYPNLNSKVSHQNARNYLCWPFQINLNIKL